MYGSTKVLFSKQPVCDMMKSQMHNSSFGTLKIAVDWLRVIMSCIYPDSPWEWFLFMSLCDQKASCFLSGQCSLLRFRVQCIRSASFRLIRC